MEEEEEFSSIGRDVWRIVGGYCGRLTRRILLMSAKSFRHLLPRSKRRGSLLTTLTARANSSPLFHLFADNGSLMDLGTYIMAARKGNVEILEYLWRRQKFCKLQIDEICREAAINNRRNVLDWLYSFMELEPFMVYTIAHKAMMGGHTELLDWLECRDVDFDLFIESERRVLSGTAASRGNFEAVLWFWRRGWRPLFGQRVAASHNLEMLHWMVKNNFLTNEDIVEGSVRLCLHNWRTGASTIINTIEEFYNPNTTYSTRVCTGAVARKSVVLMKWLHEHNFPWDWTTTKDAVRYGNLEVLRYCLRKGCPVEATELTRYAIESNNVTALKWLRNPVDEEGLPFCEPFPWHSRTVLSGCAKLELLNYLLENDYPTALWNYTLDKIEAYTLGDGSRSERCIKLQKWILKNVYAS